MIYGFDRSQPSDDEIAGLSKEVRVRVLNCSATGCLVEATAPVLPGTVAVLRIAFGGHEFDDTVRVVRCQALEGAGVYHVGTEFLSTTPPYTDTLRYLMRRDRDRLTGWLRTRDPR